MIVVVYVPHPKKKKKNLKKLNNDRGHGKLDQILWSFVNLKSNLQDDITYLANKMGRQGLAANFLQ